MSRLIKYSDLIKLNTEYARRMHRLSNRIFGENVRADTPKTRKVIKRWTLIPAEVDEYFTAYYPRIPETGMLMRKLRHYGLYRDEHQDFLEEMERMRVLKGKPTPKRIPWNERPDTMKKKRRQVGV